MCVEMLFHNQVSFSSKKRSVIYTISKPCKEKQLIYDLSLD